VPIQAHVVVAGSAVLDPDLDFIRDDTCGMQSKSNLTSARAYMLGASHGQKAICVPCLGISVLLLLKATSQRHLSHPVPAHVATLLRLRQCDSPMTAAKLNTPARNTMFATK
jgi:hypothetical protein